MKFIITGRKIEITDAIKEKVIRKIGKLDKFFNEDSQAHITLNVEKSRHIVEVTIHQKGFIFRAEEANHDMYMAIDKVVDILERQIRKNKTKIAKKLKESAFEAPVSDEDLLGIEEENKFEIVKTKKFPVKPMNVEEAILQMNMLSHEFFMFTNSENEEMNVVYRRKDGKYGLLEPKEI